jgi:hypothetical protein
MLKNGRSVFEGNIAAAAASITRYKGRDVTGTIPAQATCSLPGIGGIAEQAVKGFTRHRFAHFLSFESAKVVAEGKQIAARMAAAAGGSGSVAAAARTLQATVSATVKRASLAGRFEAREVRVEGRIISAEGGEEGPISWSGTHLKGLKLDGFTIDVELETDVADPQSARQNARSGRSYSIVRSIETKHPDAVIERSSPNTLQLPGFGAIVFGEVLSSNYTERLTLLHFELDGADSGSAQLCDVQIGLRPVAAPSRRRAAVKAGGPAIPRLVDDGLSGMPA